MDRRINELSLADWRRRVAGLYADVRRHLADDPDEALALWRRERERLFREHNQSPIPAERRSTFRARHFPANPTLRFEVPVRPNPVDARAPLTPGLTPTGDAGPLQLPVSSGDAMTFRRLGSVDVPFPAGRRRLAVFWMEGYAGGLFLPFRDATNGSETYAAGRYLLDGAKGADLGGDAGAGTLVLDFNFAYHPSCAFDPRWACPLAPPENRLDIAIRAGERLT